MGTHARDVFFKNKEKAKAVALKARFELRRSKRDDDEEDEAEDEVKVEDLDIVPTKMSIRAEGYEDVLLIEEALLGRRVSGIVEGAELETVLMEEELRKSLTLPSREYFRYVQEARLCLCGSPGTGSFGLHFTFIR